MPTTFKRAPEVETVARQYIRNYHQHLINEKIVYIFRSEPQMLRGSICLATATKKGGLDAWLIVDAMGEAGELPETYFLMQVWEQGWTDLKPKQREALVDHELAHMGVDIGNDDEEKRTINPHDLEEFECIISRHGLWLPNRAGFVRVCLQKMKTEQMALGLEDDPTDMKLHDAIEGIRSLEGGRTEPNVRGRATPDVPDVAPDPELLKRVLSILPSKAEIAVASVKREFGVGADKARAVLAALEAQGKVGPSVNGAARKVLCG